MREGGREGGIGQAVRREGGIGEAVRREGGREGGKEA